MDTHNLKPKINYRNLMEQNTLMEKVTKIIIIIIIRPGSKLEKFVRYKYITQPCLQLIVLSSMI
jgi:hypothetical protein